MKASILIADRDPGLAEAVRRCLVARGYEVWTAISGLECQEQLIKTLPTMLVIDPEIPWGGGDGVLDWLICDEPLLPPMVVVTDGPPQGRPLPDHIEPWVDVHIQRPDRIGDLLTFVHQLESLAWWSNSPAREQSELTSSTVGSVGQRH